MPRYRDWRCYSSGGYARFRRQFGIRTAGWNLRRDRGCGRRRRRRRRNRKSIPAPRICERNELVLHLLSKVLVGLSLFSNTGEAYSLSFWARGYAERSARFAFLLGRWRSRRPNRCRPRGKRYTHWHLYPTHGALLSRSIICRFTSFCLLLSTIAAFATTPESRRQSYVGRRSGKSIRGVAPF